jgi:predicted ATPase/DNA-binding winged helix-turn-helix (wHTH) protein
MYGPAITFGPFRLFAAHRLLLEGEKPVRLGSRAFDILTALVERAGEVVGKEDLIARAWPRTFVEEANLKIQVSALRRVLGDGQGGHRYVLTVPGRGYKFVTTVRHEEFARAAPPPRIAPAAAHNLPLAVTRMVGREEVVAALVARLSRGRMVTIVGPGGIGKTTVALAVAERMMRSYEHGVWLIDLAPLGDPRLVPSAVATVLGLEMHTQDPLPGLVAGLKDRRMLLLLDNCEHVIGAAFGLAAAVLGGAAGVKILATSREPLGVAGEGQYRLGPLTLPKPSSRLTAAEAEAFPAVQLFVERVTAVIEDFALTDASTPSIVEICRRLDGLPLAIEFAAARVEALGVEGLAVHLDGNLQLLRGRRRATTPRHRTMRAVLDWSYGLLNETEQRFFRVLGIFMGGFTVEAAASVAQHPATTRVDTIDRLADLVTKSLVVADVSGARPRFRLLDTTRSYTTEKLDESGERQPLARHHAQYYRRLFERAEGEARLRPASEWLAEYAPEIDNLRVALDWAFSSSGDWSVGVALTAAAVPLWMQLSLLEECGSRAEQALGALETSGTQDRRQEMRLQAALGASTPDAPEMGVAFKKVLEIAESLGDTDYQLRALGGAHFDHVANGRYRTALPLAQKFHDLTMSGSNAKEQLFGMRMLGLAKHLVGEQISARSHLEQVLAHHAPADHYLVLTRFQVAPWLSARIFLARVLWLQGFFDQAVRAADMSVAEAQATGHVVSLCHALAVAACPVALWTGNLHAAARHAGVLLDHSRRHNLPLWGEFGSRFQIVVDVKGGDIDKGLRLVNTLIVDPNPRFRFLCGLTELAEALGQTGRIAEALALIEAEDAQSESGWLTPEMLRLKGELFLSQGAPAAAVTAEGLFRQALEGARQQGARAWELRAGTSLARLLCNQDRRADAVTCLRPIHDRFTEGFGTADLIAAKQILDETYPNVRS